MPDNLKSVPFDKLHVEEGFNPRENYDNEAIQTLAKSIRQVGLLSALTVTPDNGGFKIVAGHRRYLALKTIKPESVPCIVREDDEDSLPAAMVENMHRSDLSITEIVRGVVRMKEQGWSSQKAIAEKLAIKPVEVKRAFQLHALGEYALSLVEDGVLPVNSLDALVKLNEADKNAAKYVLKRIEATPHHTKAYTANPMRVFMGYEAVGAPPCFVLDYSYDVQDLELDDEGKALLARYREELGAEPQFIVTTEVLEAAKARGNVYEFESTKFDGREQEAEKIGAFFDPELAGILATDSLKEWAETYEAKQDATDEAPEDEGEKADEEVAIASKVERNQYGEAVDPEAEKQARKEAREKRLSDQAKGEAYNAELAKQVFDRITEIDVTVGNLMPIIGLALRDGDDYIMNGLRYLHPGWVTEEGEGKRRKKVYLPKEKAIEKCIQHLREATTPEELLARVVQITMAAKYADERVVAKSNQPKPVDGFSPESVTGKVFRNGKTVSDIGLKKLTPKMQESAQSNLRSRERS